MRQKPITHHPAKEIPEIRAGQSIELLKELHILTRDGKLNQDSRRKLKQVYHLYQFIEPLLQEVQRDHANHSDHPGITLVDHGAGKSYLGFILYDLFFKSAARSLTLDPSPEGRGKISPSPSGRRVGMREGTEDESDGGLLHTNSHIYGIETREELVTHSRELAQRLGFGGMSFLNLSVADSIASEQLPAKVDVVTALHACDTATDDAINFALHKQAQFIVLVPCCQAEVAAVLRKNKGRQLAKDALTELWRHPIHTREFGSHVTNVLRCLQLEAHGYQVTVTELVGWEHSMKNELIIASYKNLPRQRATERLHEMLQTLGLEELGGRFFA